MHPLADVVVDLAHHLHPHARQREGSEALPRRPLELEVQLAPLVRKALVSPLLGDHSRHARAHGPVGVDDVELLLELRGALDGSLDVLVREDFVVEHVAVGVDDLGALIVHPLAVVLGVGHVIEDVRQIKVLRLSRRGVLPADEEVGAASDVLELLVAHVREHLAHLLADKLKVVDDGVRRARELLAQLLLLSRHTDGAIVCVADARHDAALCDHRNRPEPKLLRPHQRPEHNIPPGLHPAVDAQKHAVAQLAVEQSCVNLGQPELPGHSSVLD
mmetsp:Transcript_8570/g.17122  ORF Transcript_8570/g.17122 Transcript_8570/m.17122 type:complete len:274 (+) Transcript_8570:738-1559(+)